MKAKRIFAVLVASVMVIGMMSSSVMADGLDRESGETAAEETTETEEAAEEKTAEPEETVPEKASGDEENEDKAVITGIVKGNSPSGSHRVPAKDAGGSYGSIKWNLNGTTLTISGNGYMPNASGAESVPWHEYRSSIETFVIKKGVKSIGSYAFTKCLNISKGYIYGNTLKSLGAYAFSDTLITSFSIPKGVTVIGTGAFHNCYKMTKISLPATLKTIGTEAFSTSGVTNISIPKSVTSIGNAAFAGCIDLEKVSISGKITELKEYVFCQCYKLNSITLPGSLKTIGRWAFSNCTKLTKVSIPASVSLICEGVFFACAALTSISIPYGVKKIDTIAFSECMNLETVKLSYGLTTIEKSAFSKCEKLTSITIPSSVTTIGDYAFKNCNLEKVNITEDLYAACSSKVWENNPVLVSGPDYLIENPMTVTGKTAKVKYRKVRKKSRTVSASKVYSFKQRGQGGLIFSKVSGNKKISVNRTTGKVTVKKKIKKGTYKIKVRILASGNDKYKASDAKTVTIKIKVK